MAVTIHKKPMIGMKVIGLDISTRTGVACVTITENKIEIEAAEFTASRAAGTIPRADAIAKQVSMWIQGLWKPPYPTIWIEGYGYANHHTIVILAEVGTLVRHELYKRELEWNTVPPTSLKKLVTGKGNSPKDMMMKEVYKRWGFEGTDNECDAVGLAMFGAAVQGGIELPKDHMSAVDNWKKATAAEASKSSGKK